MIKKLIFPFLMLLNIITLGYSSNYIPDLNSIEFSRFITRYTNYGYSKSVHNGRLYVDSHNALEEYLVTDDGELILNSYYPINHPTYPEPVLYDDLMYFTYYTRFPDFHDNDIRFKVIDVSSPGMETIEEMVISTPYTSFKLGVNENYLFHTSTETLYTDIYDRESLELVGSILTGGYWTVKDNLLFMQMMSADSSAVLVKEISDINDPVELVWIKTPDREYNHSYVFDDDLMYVLKDSKVLIIDISDEDNIHLVSIIDNIPQTPTLGNFRACQRYMNYLLIVNNIGSIWVYDIEEIDNPQLTNIVHNYDGGEFKKGAMALLGDYIYFSQSTGGIRKFPVSVLPQISFEDEEYGNPGFILKNVTYADPYIFFRNQSKQLLYFRTDDEDCEVTDL